MFYITAVYINMIHIMSIKHCWSLMCQGAKSLSLMGLVWKKVSIACDAFTTSTYGRQQQQRFK